MARQKRVPIKSEEYKLAKKVAKLRLKNDPNLDYFEEDYRWTHIEIQKAVAQLMVHKSFGVKWKPKYKAGQRYNKTNLGFPAEIRTTPYPNGYLPAYKNDHDDLVLFLVTTERFPQAVTFCGWTFADKAKKKRFWNGGNKRPCYEFPQRMLESVTTFNEIKEYFD